MKEIVEKISNYNFFNYLLPGIIFAYIADKFTTYVLVENDLVFALFIYYFIGLVISRFGSLVVEPILIRFMFIKYASYNEFVAASKKDEKIELLTESNNMYRTFCSMLFLLLLLKIIEIIELIYPNLIILNPYLLVLSLLTLFLYSYKKQSQYIFNRVSNK